MEYFIYRNIHISNIVIGNKYFFRIRYLYTSYKDHKRTIRIILLGHPVFGIRGFNDSVYMCVKKSPPVAFSISPSKLSITCLCYSTFNTFSHLSTFPGITITFFQFVNKYLTFSSYVSYGYLIFECRRFDGNSTKTITLLKLRNKTRDITTTKA